MKKLKVFAAPYLVWMAVFIVVPLLMVAYFAFTNEEGHFTLDYIANVGQYTNIFVRSIWLAIIATVVCLVLAYPVSFILSRMKKHHQGTMLMIVMLPMWMNFLLRTYAWMTLLGNNGIINNLLGMIGIGPLKLINTEGAVVLGMVYNYLPFMILPLYSVMVKIDKSLIGIPIEAEPTDFMKSNNLQIIGDYTGTTDIRISGKRYDISDLKAEDFTAALDLTNVRRAGTYDLSVTIACKNDKVEYSLVENTQMAVTITVDEIAAREFPITASAPDISLPEGYYVDEITSNPPTVTITGSVSVLDEINRVEANASYDGSTLESHEVKTDLTIYKNNGSRLDNSTVKLSTDNVLVNIPILIQKELPLKFRFTGVPQNFDIDTLKYTMQPQSIMVAAPDGSINNLSELELEDPINLTDIRINQTVSTVPIKLPEGYKNLSGINSVRITWDIADYSKLDFPVSNITIVNEPDNMDVSVITRELTLTVIGPSEDISALSSTDFYVTANLLSTSLHDGSQDVPVSIIISGSSGKTCWAVGSYKITVSAVTTSVNEE